MEFRLRKPEGQAVLLTKSSVTFAASRKSLQTRPCFYGHDDKLCREHLRESNGRGVALAGSNMILREAAFMQQFALGVLLLCVGRTAAGKRAEKKVRTVVCPTCPTDQELSPTLPYFTWQYSLDQDLNDTCNCFFRVCLSLRRRAADIHSSDRRPHAMRHRLQPGASGRLVHLHL